MKKVLSILVPKLWSALAILSLIYLVTYPDQIMEGLIPPDFAFTKMLVALAVFIVATFKAGGFKHDEVEP